MSPEASKIRVLLTKAQLDGHDRGVRTVARSLRDSGMEVILTDYRLPEDIVSTALQEEVDIIGISFSSGGQVRVSQEVLGLLKKNGREDTPLIVGGSIPPFDVPKLKEMGVKGIFRQGSRIESIVEQIRSLLGEKAAFKL